MLLSAVVTPSGSPMAGQSFSLTCYAAEAGTLTPIAYEWRRGQSLVASSSVLRFESLFLSDAGEYKCEVTVRSDRLGEQSVNSAYDVQFQSEFR